MMEQLVEVIPEPGYESWWGVVDSRSGDLIASRPHRGDSLVIAERINDTYPSPPWPSVEVLRHEVVGWRIAGEVV